MARRERVILVCDITGAEVQGVATRRFQLDGEECEIDLAPDKSAQLDTILAEYVRAARRLKR